MSLNDSCKVACTLSLPESLEGRYSNLTHSELSWDSQIWSGSGDGNEGVFCILAVPVNGLIFFPLSNSYCEALNIHPNTTVLAVALSKLPED